MNVCPACGAEESLDGLLGRMIDDADTRRLIADVLTTSLPLGGDVVRYLRLHKPAKQRLRMSRVAALLAELVPDIKRGAITRKGRDWQAGHETWRMALAAVHEAKDKGTLQLPLDGNAYLYEVIVRMVDRHERDAEGRAEAERQNRRAAGWRDPGATSVAQVVAQAVTQAAVLGGKLPAAAPLPLTQPPPPAYTGPSRAALKLRAEIEATLAQRQGGTTEQPATTTAEGANNHE
ncbi:hypothetical protein [Ideonella paludis]|uniref:hypothetical protein n=1 Tax=Ideonella paludis TaxID=1233411 RepID=UPI003638776F